MFLDSAGFHAVFWCIFIIIVTLKTQLTQNQHFIYVWKCSVMKDTMEGKVITTHKTWATTFSLSAHINILTQCLCEEVVIIGLLWNTSPPSVTLVWQPTRFSHAITLHNSVLTLWRRIFFSNLAHPVFKMWVIQKPNKVALWNKRHFEEKEMEIIHHV